MGFVYWVPAVIVQYSLFLREMREMERAAYTQGLLGRTFSLRFRLAISSSSSSWPGVPLYLMRTPARGRVPMAHFSPESRSRLKGLAAERMSFCWTGEVVPDSDMVEKT